MAQRMLKAVKLALILYVVGKVRGLFASWVRGKSKSGFAVRSFPSETLLGVFGTSFWRNLLFRKSHKTVGFVKPGWEKVRDAFEKNYALNLELGSQLVVYKGDELMVDLYGVSKNKITEGYNSETLQVVFSSGKNLEVLAMALLVKRGLVKYEAKVSEYWPEFAQNGKEDVTVADIMRHESGIPAAYDKDGKCVLITLQDTKDVDSMDKKYAESHLVPEARGKPSKRAYNARNRGYLVSAIIRRVDPKRRTIKAFLHEEVFPLLGVDRTFIGIGEAEVDHLNYAPITPMNPLKLFSFVVLPVLLGVGDPIISTMFKKFSKAGDRLNPPNSYDWVPRSNSPAFHNTRQGRMLEASSAGVYSNARSLAKALLPFANGGDMSGDLLSSDIVETVLDDTVSNIDNSLEFSYGMTKGGFGDMKHIFTEESKYFLGNLPEAHGYYGWWGWGGSACMINPETNITLVYTPIAMGLELFGDKRYRSLMRSLPSQ